MNLPKRKRMRLKGYDYSSFGAYFITICARNRECIFGTVQTVGDDAHIVPQILLSEHGRTVNKYIQTIPGIDKYVIMPNHIHMVITNYPNGGTMWASSPTASSVSQAIKTFKTLVTKKIGFSVFQRTFFDHIIRNRDDYREIVKYIYENPQKWKNDCFWRED